MYCKKCGKELKDTDRFCSGCGARIDVNDSFATMAAGIGEKKEEAPKRESRKFHLEGLSWDLAGYPSADEEKGSGASTNFNWSSVVEDRDREIAGYAKKDVSPARPSTSRPASASPLENRSYDSRHTDLDWNTGTTMRVERSDKKEFDDFLFELEEDKPNSEAFRPEFMSAVENRDDLGRDTGSLKEAISSAAIYGISPTGKPDESIWEEAPAAAEDLTKTRVVGAADDLAKTRVVDYSEDALESSRKKIDKFYTFNKKNEEFQALLDQEYERLRERIREESKAEEELAAKQAKLEAMKAAEELEKQEALEAEKAAKEAERLAAFEAEKAALEAERAAFEAEKAALEAEKLAALEAEKKAAAEAVQEAPAVEAPAISEEEEFVLPEMPDIEDVIKAEPEAEAVEPEIAAAAAESAEEAVPEAEEIMQEVQTEQAEVTPVEEVAVEEAPEAAPVEEALTEEAPEAAAVEVAAVPEEAAVPEVQAETVDNVVPEDEEIIILDDGDEIEIVSEPVSETAGAAAAKEEIPKAFEPEAVIAELEAQAQQVEKEIEAQGEHAGEELKGIPTAAEPGSGIEIESIDDVLSELPDVPENESSKPSKAVRITEETIAPAAAAAAAVTEPAKEAEKVIEAEAPAAPEEPAAEELPEAEPARTKKHKERRSKAPERQNTFGDIFEEEDEDDDVDRDTGRKKGRAKLIFLDILIVILALCVACAAILVFAEGTPIAQKLQSGIDKVVSLVTGDKSGEQEGEPEDVVSYTAKAIENQLSRNTNIDEVAEDTALMFSNDGDYGIPDVATYPTLEDREMYTDPSGKTMNVSDAIVGTTIEYYSKLIDRMNTNDQGVLALITPGSQLYGGVSAITADPAVQHDITKLQIGEIKENDQNFYVLVRLTQTVSGEADPTISTQVVHLTVDGTQVYINDIVDAQ